MQRWKTQAPFDRSSFFVQRLALDELSETDFLALLAEPAEALQARMIEAPEWLALLQEAFDAVESSRDIPLPSLPADANINSAAFLSPFQPLLQAGLNRLEQGVQHLLTRYTHVPFDPDTIASLLFAGLARHLTPKISRTFVLELHVARLQGRLSGETAEARFQSYLDWLHEPAHLQSLLQEYCVLARQLVMSIEQWVRFSLEWLDHLCADWHAISEVFAADSVPGILKAIAGGVGDTHRDGRSVLILTFSSGLRLVYKPRSLAVDMHFQQLLSWLNLRGQQPTFRTLKLLDRGSYGWSEFVEASSCHCEEKIARFYERQGAYIALLYALDAVDFHFENVIAAGEHPVLVDLEALFHPRIDLDLSELPGRRGLDHTVLAIGLLPVRRWTNNESEGIDISGLGGREGQIIPQAMRTWTGSGTDEMRVVKEQVELQGQRNRPRLNGRDVATHTYCEQIITGFTRTYKLLMAHRDELLAQLLPRFAHDEIRFIARATRLYGMLLSESFHPNMLRDALQRDRCFDRLWYAVQYRPPLSRLIAAERADLLNGDIPLFTARPASRNLYTSRGEPIADFFATPSLEEVGKRIRQLNDEDLAWQRWIIQASFSSMSIESDAAGKKELRLSPAQPSHIPVSKQRLIEGARAVGEQLCDMVIHREGVIGWLSVMQAKGSGDKWNLLPADISLYGGHSGIALFLAYLGHITGEEHYTMLARMTLKTIHHEIAQIQKRARFTEISAFIGLGAPIYLFTHLGVLWNKPDLVREARELVTLLPPLISQDDRLDISAGAAGCIASLLSLYAVDRNAATLAVAVQCGDHLLSQARQMPEGVGWKTRAYIHYPPTPGFAHGTAGIAWSLLALANASEQERFRQTALEALAYERSLFSPEKQNWLMPLADAASPSTQGKTEERQPAAMSWNQGTPGIGLSRLASLKFVNEADKAMLYDDIEIALEQTISAGFDSSAPGTRPNHSLSHGYFGNIETLLVATRTLDEPCYNRNLERLTAMLLDSIDTYGWITAAPVQVETPGLMAGLAGIGYELLRLAEPERVPSVLLLEPPCMEKPFKETLAFSETAVV